ncbi:MAG: hypothetical protein JW863_21870 [Chitinispirillaceae bacterium]|nr:hypothetical protein [Chitinispirillaceae bacterium]
MKKNRNELFIGLIFLGLSIAAYTVHYLIFRDPHHIFIYLVGDIAFVFIEVFLVTLIIHRVLDERDKKQRLEKLNMVIGAFFSEVGTQLLTKMAACDPSRDILASRLVIDNKWTCQEFGDVVKWLKVYSFSIDHNRVNWEEFKTLLGEKRDFLLRLFENQNLLEHESFSELLQAVFHLAEELVARNSFTDLPVTDSMHLTGDVTRGYKLLIVQWALHINHLKKDYPYLFSLAVRQNPFDSAATVVVKE